MLDDYPNLALASTVALAKLGNQGKASVAISLAHHIDTTIRIKAVKALKYVVGNGLFPTIQKVLKDSCKEVRQDAIDAIFYLGERESINELFKYTEDQDPEIMENVLYRLYDLTAVPFYEGMYCADIRNWWDEHNDDFDQGVCYRLGKPIDLQDIIATFKKKEPGWRSLAAEEWQIITGNDLNISPFLSIEEQDELVERAESWLIKEGSRFEKGRLYKFGFEQDLEIIF